MGYVRLTGFRQAVWEGWSPSRSTTSAWSFVLTTDLADLAEDFEACDSIKDKEYVLQKACDIDIGYLDVVATQPTAGKVLQHCKKKMSQFRHCLGGAVCVFKIGYSTNPIQRFASYRNSNFSRMLLLHATDCKGVAEMLEASLIDMVLGTSGCRNEKPGGEGPPFVRSSHYFVYIVGARADQPKRIGG